jgi:hypothetical protein
MDLKVYLVILDPQDPQVLKEEIAQFQDLLDLEDRLDLQDLLDP